METSILNRNFSFIVCFSGIILIFMIACHSNSPEKSKSGEPEIVEMGNGEILVESDLKNGFTPQDVKKIKDVMVKNLRPLVSGKDKEAFVEIIEYLDDTQKKASDYFDAPKNSIQFATTLMRLALMDGRLKPDNFDANLNVSLQYLQLARVIEQLEKLHPSEDDRRLSEEYKKKGIQSAKDLVEKFPNNAKAYGHLAHTLYYIAGGEMKKSADLYKRCLEIDGEMEFCKEGYNALSKN